MNSLVKRLELSTNIHEVFSASRRPLSLEVPLRLHKLLGHFVVWLSKNHKAAPIVGPFSRHCETPRGFVDSSTRDTVTQWSIGY